MTVVGVSLKTYLGPAASRDWCERVAERLGTHPAITGGRTELFVAPTYLGIADALAIFRGTPIRVAAQNASAEGGGAFTGEVLVAHLAEVGVSAVEVGHAERRAVFGEDDALVARKTAAVLRHGLTPVLCVGEVSPDGAAEVVAGQLASALDGAASGPVVVAYEPVWAIGAPEPAPPAHVVPVVRRVRDVLDGMPGRTGSAVIYGGAARPGLLTLLGGEVDGLFLGRFAHDPAALAAVIDEADALAG